MLGVVGDGREKLGYKGDSDQCRECLLRRAHRDDLQPRAYPTTS